MLGKSGKTRSFATLLLLLRFPAVGGNQLEESVLASCEDQPGNLLLQKHAQGLQAPQTPESKIKPWDRRNYVVLNSHKGGTELIRNVMRRAFTILGANHSCKMEWDYYDLPLTPTGQNWCHNDTSAPIIYENGNRMDTIQSLRKKGPLRGVMMIRDPYSLIVSAYTYHHRGEEIGRMGVPQSITTMDPKEGIPFCAWLFEHTVKDMVGAYEARGDDILATRFEDWTRSAADFNSQVAQVIDFLFGNEITKEQRSAILKSAQEEDANGPYGLSRGWSVKQTEWLKYHSTINRSNHSNNEIDEDSARSGLSALPITYKIEYEFFRKLLGYA